MLRASGLARALCWYGQSLTRPLPWVRSCLAEVSDSEDIDTEEVDQWLM